MTKRSASSQSAGRGGAKRASTGGKALSATAEELDRRFDAGEDMSAYLDWAQARRPGREIQRVNVDFPVDLLALIDREATRLGVSRQSFIKIRIADTLMPSPAASVAASNSLMVRLQQHFDDARAAKAGKKAPVKKAREQKAG